MISLFVEMRDHFLLFCVLIEIMICCNHGFHDRLLFSLVLNEIMIFLHAVITVYTPIYMKVFFFLFTFCMKLGFHIAMSSQFA